MKRHAKFRKLVPLLGIAALLGIVQAAAGIGIQPHRVSVAVPQGGEEWVEIVLINTAESAQRVDISLVGVRSQSDGSIEWLSAAGADETGTCYPYANLEGCISFEPSSITISPGSESILRLHVKAPDLLTEGEMAGRVGALWFDVSERVEGGLFDSVIRFVSFVLVEFEGGQSRTADLTAWSARQEASGDLAFPVVVRNTGNVHISPTWQVTIRDRATDQIIEQLSLSEGTLLPDCPREVVALWRAVSLQDGAFDVEFALSSDTTLLVTATLRNVVVENGVLVRGGV